jgi:hypothetical protein
MERSQVVFGGVMPRLNARLLPATLGQDATNARLVSGNLEAWRQFALTYTIPTFIPPIETIYLLRDAWLVFTTQADVAPGPVPGDTTERTYITDPDRYATPVWTTYSMATTGSPPYPVAVRPLGVPAPLDAPACNYIPQSGIDTSTITDYVMTLVNDVGEESAPSSPASSYPGATLLYTPSGGGDYNNVDMFYRFESSFDDYKIRKARLYRAATGATGTIFRFVVEKNISDFVPDGGGLFVLAYSDFAADTALGEPLPSSDWDLPLAAMQGILSLPNGIMAGFKGNILCLSAQNHPHAWPVGNQLTTDSNIVGIENVDTSVVILTKTFPYIASGVDPSQYSMVKFEFAEALASKTSVALVRGIGVVGATALGLYAFQGIGQLTNLTEKYFTSLQWQALNPPSIIGVVHNNIYFFAWKNGGQQGAYALDMNPTGFGLVPLSFHFTAAYNDPITDRLYLVLDSVNEPTSPNLPLGSTAPTPTGVQIYEFDSADGSGNLVYKYTSRFNLLERPACFTFAQLRADDFTNVVLRFIADGNQIYNKPVTADAEFRVDSTGDQYTTFQWTLIGTSSVRSVQAAEGVEELLASSQAATMGQ